jgi:hypothetical protein
MNMKREAGRQGLFLCEMKGKGHCTGVTEEGEYRIVASGKAGKKILLNVCLFLLYYMPFVIHQYSTNSTLYAFTQIG